MTVETDDNGELVIVLTNKGSTGGGAPDAGAPDAGAEVTVPSSVCEHIKEMADDPNMSFPPPEGMAADDERWVRYTQDLEEYANNPFDLSVAERLRLDVEEIKVFCDSQAAKQKTQPSENPSSSRGGGNASETTSAGDEQGGFGGEE